MPSSSFDESASEGADEGDEVVTPSVLRLRPVSSMSNTGEGALELELDESASFDIWPASPSLI